MKIHINNLLLIKMEVDTRFLDILVNPEYKDYKEVCIIVEENHVL